MRRSNVDMPPITVVFQVASLVIIAASLAWISIKDTKREPLAAKSEPPTQTGKVVNQR